MKPQQQRALFGFYLLSWRIQVPSPWTQHQWFWCHYGGSRILSLVSPAVSTPCLTLSRIQSWNQNKKQDRFLFFSPAGEVSLCYSLLILPIVKTDVLGQTDHRSVSNETWRFDASSLNERWRSPCFLWWGPLERLELGFGISLLSLLLFSLFTVHEPVAKIHVGLFCLCRTWIR